MIIYWSSFKWQRYFPTASACCLIWAQRFSKPWSPGSGRQITAGSAMDTALIPFWPKGTENGQQTLVGMQPDKHTLAYRAVWGRWWCCCCCCCCLLLLSLSLRGVSLTSLPPLPLWQYFKFCIRPVWSKPRPPQVSRVFFAALPCPPSWRRGSRAGGSTGASEALPALVLLHTGTPVMNKDLVTKYWVIFQ